MLSFRSWKLKPGAALANNTEARTKEDEMKLRTQLPQHDGRGVAAGP